MAEQEEERMRRETCVCVWGPGEGRSDSRSHLFRRVSSRASAGDIPAAPSNHTLSPGTARMLSGLTCALELTNLWR